jgi:hypothetical protein
LKIEAQCVAASKMAPRLLFISLLPFGHAPVLRPPARNAWRAPVSWRTDGAGGRFSPGVMCRSMNRLVSSERLTSESNARSSNSPAMSWHTSPDQPSAVLKATTRSAFPYWPVRKLQTMVHRRWRGARLSVDVINNDQRRPIWLING